MIRSRRRWTALAALGAVLVAGFVAGPASPAQAQAACSITYAKQWDSGSGFGANVTINNTGTTAINGWTVNWTFAGNQRVTNAWIGRLVSPGPNVSIASESWSANIPAGGSLTFGFNASYTGTNTNPTAFTLNGAQCGGQQQNPPPTVTITSPNEGATFSAPADITVNATASDPGGSVARVDFFINGNLAGSDASSPYTFTHQDVPAGSYNLVAQAVDNLNATGSDDVNVTVTPSVTPTVLTTLNTVNIVAGETGTYGVRLSQQPAGNVQVTTSRTSGNTGFTVASGGTLTFTPQNWNNNQTVTIAAAATTANQSAVFTSTAAGHQPATVTTNGVSGTGQNQEWIDNFLEQYDKIKNSGYFSSQGIPYHSIEELIVEAPDYGHVTTSEAYSYWLWLEAYFGRVTENWQPFNAAWQNMETFIIPANADQASAGVAGTAIYAAEHPNPNAYPSALQSSVPVGQDPLRNELQSTYGTGSIYGMHWILDVDNAYGFGRCGNGTTTPAYINTFQRGQQESVWETIPHPSCDNFAFGGPQGYVPLFVSDPQGPPAQQWRYTNAPDADARAVQVAYWASVWAAEQGQPNAVSAVVADASRMGDYLRYAMFDKYFKQIGNCVGATQCPAGSGRNSAHFLMSWYFAWGGSFPGNEWSWRIGSSHNHFGYQNPVAAWALSTVPSFVPDSPTAQSDWTQSLDRQLEFYRWLQSAEGAIAGGATNSWNGSYATPPAGTPTFYGMFYDDCPVYEDPCSNEWTGFQAWSMQRIAEYIHLVDDPAAEELLSNWVDWLIPEITIGTGGNFQIPIEMSWTGAPATWNPNNPQPNNNLHVDVVSHNQDVGVAASMARTLIWYAAATGDTEAQETGLGLLEALLANADAQGVATPETREDYDRFNDTVFVPNGFSGEMANGEAIQPGSTFISLRESIYEGNPDLARVMAYANGTGPAPTFEYHRFWAQVDVAAGFADYAFLFPEG
jgi:hypothetical protein